MVKLLKVLSTKKNQIEDSALEKIQKYVIDQIMNMLRLSSRNSGAKNIKQ